MIQHRRTAALSLPCLLWTGESAALEAGDADDPSVVFIAVDDMND